MVPCFYNFNSRTPLRIGKTTTAWWLASNWDNIIPMDVECQVNDEKRQIFQKANQTWFLLGKRVATYNFAASLPFTAQSLFRTILDHCSRWPADFPKLRFLCSRPMAQLPLHGGRRLTGRLCREMANQQSEKQSFPNTNLDPLVKTGSR